MSAAAHPSYTHLRPYQQSLADLLADSTETSEIVPLRPGFGRRSIAIAAAESLPFAGADPRILVIAPKVICEHWHSEWKKWGKTEAVVTNEPLERVVNIVSLSTLSCARGADFLRTRDLLIVDWAYALRSSPSRRTRTLSQIRQQAGRSWLLTLPLLPSSKSPLPKRLGKPGRFAASIDFHALSALGLETPPPMEAPGPLLRPSALAERALALA